MKKWSLIFLVLILTSCGQDAERLLGDWKVNSQYYKATYQFAEEEGEIIAKVLYYNDGTSKYHWNKREPWLLSSKIEQDKPFFVDASTGATQQISQIKFQLLAKDSLEMSMTAFNGVSKEIWTKVENLKTDNK